MKPNSPTLKKVPKKVVKPKVQEVDPEKMKITRMQAERLGTMYNIEAKNLEGLTVAELSNKFRYQIDPMALFFRKVCGKVVKKDPVTGTDHPVPFATVYVEDTDCSLLGYFPIGGMWVWYFPFHCHREVIATTHTDECGNFCAWIPRWDIDWILRFRHARICFPIIFERPRLRDILEEFNPGDYRIPFPHPWPDPEPDPRPYHVLDRASLVKVIEDNIGRGTIANLDKLVAPADLDTDNAALSAALDAPAFSHPLPPPLPNNFHVPSVANKAAKMPDMDTARSTLAAQLRVETAEFKELDLHHYIGPFRRCFDIFFPEWVPFFDVPDITFRVTQDTDGDGDEETIYSEGFFDVRWNSGPISDVTLHAQPNARAGLPCPGGPAPSVPCGNEPAILMAGRMPVVNVPTVYNPTSGYALRPNRPHPSGAFVDPLPNPDAETPFHSTLSLLGCLVPKPGTTATHYRVLYEYSSNGGGTYTPPVPFTGRTWPLFRLDASANAEWYYPAADSNGWYPIAPPPPHNVPGLTPFMPQNLVFDWNTRLDDKGRYRLTLELGTGGVMTSHSASVAFNVDNSYPSGPLTIEWRKAGIGAFQPLTYPCPLVRRGALPVDVEFRVTMPASATHLRSAQIYGWGCGGGGFTVLSGTTQHWHTNPADNSVTLQAVYHLPAAAMQGTYSFGGYVVSRAMNPSGWDGGHLILPNPWEYNPSDIYITPSFSFSVIDSN
jgi:hypothetical protein